MGKRRKRQKKEKIKYASLNQAPGQVTYVGSKTTETTHLEIINYDKELYEKKESSNIEDALHLKDTEEISWINVNGLNKTNDIEKLGQHFGLHPLLIEDIVNTKQRPKIDEYDHYLFIVLKMLYYDTNNELVNEHISIVLGPNYVVTFQEADGDVFNGVRERIFHGRGRIRNSKSDYLMYALIDAVIDNYFAIIEVMGDKIEALEDNLFLDNQENDGITQDIQDLKREILKIRRAVYPLREVVNRLEKNEHSLIEEKTQHYLRDLYDHIIQVSENIEIYREMIWGLMDMYMTTISNKMNEVMKVLTIMASIFIPLTFMAGIYGMNFEYMPELKLKYGYFYLWGAMLAVFIAMLWYFKRKKWL